MSDETSNKGALEESAADSGDVMPVESPIGESISDKDAKFSKAEINEAEESKSISDRVPDQVSKDSLSEDPELKTESSQPSPEKPTSEKATTRKVNPGRARGAAKPNSKGRKAKPKNSESEDLELEADDEHGGEAANEGVDDPLAPGFDLEKGAPLDEISEEIMPWESKIDSAKEFFSTEILYRFDIIEPAELDPLKGSYRIDLDGDGGGSWTLNLGTQLEIASEKNDADTVLRMKHRDFIEVVNGKLNPQLAILSQKIKVTGDVTRAIRLQELLVPTAG